MPQLEPKGKVGRQNTHLSEREDEVRLLHFETDAEEVAHGNVHIPSVNPPSMGMNWDPIRKEPAKDEYREEFDPGRGGYGKKFQDDDRGFGSEYM